MPEPMTAPIPSAVRLHGPSVLRSRLSGCSEAAISASMLRVRKSLPKSPLPLALHQSSDLLLQRSSRHARGPLRLRGRLLARRALQLLTLFGFLYGLCIHALVNPAYFST